MRTSSASRFTILSTLAALSACGQTLNVGSRGAGGSSASDQGVGGNVDGSVGGNVGAMITSGGTPPNQPKAGRGPGGAADDLTVGGSDAGAGAPGEPGAPLYDFVLIPALPAPTVPPSDAQPGDEISFDVYPSSASADGKVIFGSSETFYRHVNSSLGATDAALFAWTAATGTQRIGAGFPVREWPDLYPSPSCVASDGSSALFQMGSGPEAFKISRWTSATGLVPLALPLDFHDAYLQNCSPDATRAVADTPESDANRPLYWQLGKNQNAFTQAATLPAGAQSQLALSLDGTAGILSVSGEGVAGVDYYRWQPDSAPVKLVFPTGYSCQGEFLSANGNVIAGTCYGNAGNREGRLFRWTPAGGLVLLDQPVTQALLLSADGNTLFVTNDANSQLMVFLGETLTKTVQMQPEMSVTFKYGADAVVPVSAANDAGSRPGVFTKEGNLRLLPVLPKLPFNQLTLTVNEGTIGIGAAWPAGTQVQDAARGDGVAVVWDQIGIRDVAAELLAAHVDLQQAGGLVAEHVWLDDRTIRIEGRCWTENQFNHQVFVATLPRR